MNLFKLSRASLNARLLLIVAVVAVGLICLVTVNALESRSEQMDARVALLRTHVESAMAIAEGLHKRAEKGEISEQQAKDMAQARIEDIRWDNGTGYIYGFGDDFTMRVSPLRPQDLGKNMENFTDAKGKAYFGHMRTVDHKQGGGLTLYTFKKPGTDHAVQKVAYSQYFKPWKLHFVSGAYVDDIDAQFIHTLEVQLSQAMIVALIVMLVIWLTMRSIRRSIGGEPAESVQLVNRMADGDLSVAGAADLELPPGSMMHAMQRLHIKLIEVIGSVQTGADAVGHVADEISRDNEDLSQRTQEQAANLQQTAASMEEMTSTVRHNADNATQANQLVDGARQQAEQGGEIMEEAVTAMNDIDTSSRKIVDIVAMIDEIAFQTNLLALNASVEAARAGEHGRGFSVVASEVRTLSQRSAAAAKDIKALVDESVSRVETGSKLVGQSGEALRGIVDSVKRVSDIVSEITTASHEQSTGIDQVNQAVTQMDSVTQQNAAMVDAVAGAAQDMQARTAELKREVAYFRLENSDSAAPRQPSQAAQLSAPKATPKPQQPQRKPAAPKSATRLAAATTAAADEDDWTEF